jgi:hypothetical protein
MTLISRHAIIFRRRRRLPAIIADYYFAEPLSRQHFRCRVIFFRFHATPFRLFDTPLLTPLLSHADYA